MDNGIKFCVKYIYELSDFVGGRKVVRQGCSLTSYLFNVFVADFIHCIGVDTMAGKMPIPGLSFAYDLFRG